MRSLLHLVAPTMTHRVIAAAALALALAAPTSRALAAGAFPEDVPLERLATAPGYAVVLLEVLRADPGAATQRHPPMLAVRVERVLLGAAPLGPRVARWMPPPLRTPATGAYAERLARAWADTPLPAPAAGARLLALTHEVDGVAELAARYRLPATAPAEAALWELAATSKVASRAARRAAKKALDARARDEALRLEEADPKGLLARATVVASGRFAPLTPGAEGDRVELVVEAPLRGVDPEASAIAVALPTPEERDRYTTDGAVVVFLAPSRWYAPDGTLTEGLRPVDPRFAVLPATPELVRALTPAP